MNDLLNNIRSLDEWMVPWVIAIIVTIVIAILALTPIVFIWAVNTLFGVSIALTFKNAVAVLVLLTLVRGGK